MLSLALSLAAALPPAAPHQEPLAESVADAIDKGFARRMGEPTKQHWNFVSNVAYSPAGDRVVSAGWDWMARVWDARTGAAVRALEHEGLLYWALFCQDGESIVSATMEGDLWLWDVERGQRRAHLEVGTTLQAGAISPDGMLLAAANPEEEVIRLYTFDQKEIVPVGELPHEAEGMLLRLAFSSDGKRLASGGGLGAFVQVHDIGTKEVIFAVESPLTVNAIAWDPSGESLLLGGYDTLARFDLETREVVDGMGGHEASTRGISVGPEGRIIYFGDGDGGVHGWDLAAGEAVFYTAEHRDTVSSTALSPDGKHLVSGSHDGSVRFWGLESGREELVAPGHTNMIEALRWSPDGARLATGCYDNSVCEWDPRRNEMTSYATDHEYSVSGVDYWQGKLVSASTDATIRTWEDGKEVGRIDLEDYLGTPSCFAVHGDLGAFGTYQGLAGIVNLKSGEVEVTIHDHEDMVTSVRWIPEKDQLVTTCLDGSVSVFDAEGERSLRIENKPTEPLLDGWMVGADWIVVIGESGAVSLRDLDAGVAKWTIEPSEDGWHDQIAVSPDGERVAIYGADGLALHDGESGERLAVVTMPETSIACMAFSPDGKYLACGMEDSTVLKWRVEKLLK